MKAKRIVIAIAVLVLVIAMACMLASCDPFGGGGGSDDKDTTYEVILDCDSSKGSVSGGGKFKQGDSVTIIATANEGYSFIGWYDGETLVSTNHYYSFIMGDNNVTYTAKYKKLIFVKLECSPEEGELIGEDYYEKGSKVEIRANSKAGYEFKGWYRDGEELSTNARLTITIGDENVTYTAKFEADPNLTIFDYSVENGIYIINGLKNEFKSSKEIVIPDYIKIIAASAFYNCSSLTSVIIPNSVTSIGDDAFEDCSNISEVKYNGTIEQWFDIGGLYNLMGYSSNKKLFIGDNEITGNLVIPDGITSIGSYPFYGCSGLTSVTIPDSVTSIGYGAFYGCDKITEIRYTGDIAGWCAIRDLICMTNISNKKLYIGNNEITGNLVIPDNVTSIGECAFYGCSGLTSVIIPDSVISISNSAFWRCDKITEIRYTGDIAEWCAIKGLDNLMRYGSNKKLYIGDNEITGDLVIPNSVTSIGSGAFYGCSSLTSVTIPDCVTSIYWEAFSYCSSISEVKYNGTIEQWLAISGLDNLMRYGSNKKLYIGGSELTELVIPNSVTSIGDGAFYGCSSLTSVTIPVSVTSIGEYAFRGCSGLTSVTIPDSVTSIGEYAFRGCSSLTSVTIGSSVTSIGESAFEGCSGLTNVTIGNGVTSIGESAFEGCSGLTNVTIGNGVTSIGESAFEGCSSLTSVTIPVSVTSIGEYAFRGCSGLTSVTIPDSVTSIGEYAFRGCSSLTSVTIGNGVTSIEYSAFRDCSTLASVTIGSSVTSIGNYAFYGCSSLTSITIPNSVTSIGNYAFYGCSSLTSVTIGSGVTSIGNYAFSRCSSLTSITIGSGVTSIGWSAFSNCYVLAEVYNLSSLNIAKGSSSYGDVAYFAHDVYTSLSEPSKLTEKDGMILHTDGINVTLVRYIGNETSAIIPNEITSISKYAFRGCSSLASVTIPNSVTNIGSSAFEGCYALAEVYNLSSLGITKGSSSYGYIAYYARDVYTSLLEPSKLTEKDGMILHTEGNNVTLIRYIGDATSILIPDSVTSIGDHAFYGCSSLTSVTIPNSVTSIGSSAFENCNNLTSVTIGNSVTSIGSSAFENCNNLTSVTIGNSVTSIGYRAFEDCSSLTSVTIGNSVTSIGDWAFRYCSSLTSITIPNSVTSIGTEAFYYCDRLTSITIPDSVTSIGERAFYGCSSLTSVTFENTSGWFVSESSYATSGTDVTVTDPSQNAKHLTSTYYSYYWKRK